MKNKLWFCLSGIILLLFSNLALAANAKYVDRYTLKEYASLNELLAHANG